jgi:exonuclease SbcD
MRILHCSDIHLGLNKFGSTLADTEAILDAIVLSAMKNEVHAVAIAGDIFHVRRPGPHEILSFVRMARALADRNIVVLVSPGNHDGPGTITDPSGKSAAWMNAAGIPLVYAFPEPWSGIIATAGGPLAVASLPYPHKRSFDALMPNASAGERMRAVSRAMADAIAEKAEELAALGVPAPRLFMGHLVVSGATVGTETDFRMGWDVSVPATSFDLFDYAALGHIHKMQQLTPKAWYSGNPDRQHFGEEHNEKGWLIVDVERGRMPTVQVVPSPCRRFMTVQTDGTVMPLIEPGSVVRVRVPHGRYVRWVTDGLYQQGASWVKVEVERNTERRPRAVVATTIGPFDGLRMWLETTELPVEPYTSIAHEILEGES